MQKDVMEVDIKGVVPTSNGSALFLGTKDKTMVIHVDGNMGKIILMSLNGEKKDRPMTHDLIANIFKGLHIQIDRVVINHTHEGTFYARLILKMQNEIGTKFLEIDARPSDSIILALQSGRPIYVAKTVMDAVEDMTDVLDKILKQQDGS